MRISSSSLWVFLFIFTTTSAAVPRNLQSSTPRNQTSQNETTNHLPPPTNIADVLDVRTPPKIKQMMKKNEQKHMLSENSHPGVAEPVDEDAVSLEDSLKKMNFYKLEPKSTTDSGLSTWILLSGQSISSTPKSVKSNVKAVNETKNITIGNVNRIVKPVFKKKTNIGSSPSVSSTVKPINKETSTSTTQRITLTKVETEKTTKGATTITTTEAIPVSSASTVPEVTQLTKVKAAALNNAMTSTKNSNGNTDLTNSSKVGKKKDKDNSKPQSSTIITTEGSISSTTISALNLKPELKDGDLELAVPPNTTSTPKKSRRPSQKKKKDKNRRRRPTVEDKVDSNNNKENKTKVAVKDKPISTQIYNYLAREVMPTVGVGLVGLVVTAGLASYFLYPFSGLRRSYEVDRRDKDNVYYYENEYSGGVPEEEAIGKVIAGMPWYVNEYKQQSMHSTSPKTAYAPSNRYRYSDSNYYSPQATVEEVPLDPLKDYKNDGNYLQETYQTNEVHKNEPITYNKDVISKNVEAAYSASDQQYVVGNIPKEVQEVTPVTVPEHGPRNLKLRRRKREVVEKNNLNENSDTFKGYKKNYKNYKKRVIRT